MSQPANMTAPQFPPGYLEENQSGKVIGAAIAFLIITTVAVGLRFVSRRLQKSPFIWADALIPLAWFIDTASTVSALVCVHFGAGKHLPAVPPEDIIPFFKVSYWVVPIIYSVGVNIPKLAVCDVYLHLFIDKWSRWTIYVVQFILVACIIFNVIFVGVQCIPMAALWDPTIPGGHCHDIRAHFFWSAVPNIVTDFILLVLPLPLIRNLQTSWGTKIGLAATFLLGNLGLVFSILRLLGFRDQYVDFTWITADGLVWTIVEPSVYLLCGCLIAYRPLFRWIAHESPLSSYIARSFLSRTLTSRGNASEVGPHTTNDRGIATWNKNSTVKTSIHKARSNSDTFSPASRSDIQMLTVSSEHESRSSGSERGGIRVQYQVETSSTKDHAF